MMRRLIISLAFMVVAACAPAGRPLTPNDITSYGTARFDAPIGKVFRAVQEALKAEGYQVATADTSKYLVKTDRKLVRAVAVGNQYSAQATEITRQYVIKLRPEGAQTVMVAEPRVFQGDMDLSAEAVWDMDSPMGERALWNQLFKDVREAL